MFGRIGDLVGGSVPRLSNCRLRPCHANANYKAKTDTTRLIRFDQADRNVTALASDMLALSFLPLPSIRARVH